LNAVASEAKRTRHRTKFIKIFQKKSFDNSPCFQVSLLAMFFCDGKDLRPSQAKPSQAKPSQAKPSQAKPSQASIRLLDVCQAKSFPKKIYFSRRDSMRKHRGVSIVFRPRGRRLAFSFSAPVGGKGVASHFNTGKFEEVST